jgi:hypothetical protein
MTQKDFGIEILYFEFYLVWSLVFCSCPGGEGAACRISAGRISIYIYAASVMVCFSLKLT